MIRIDMPMPDSCEKCRFNKKGACVACANDVDVIILLKKYEKKSVWCPLLKDKEDSDD